jgi:anti-sigma factor RsiW
MTCRDAGALLSLFFDGELDSSQMRAVALHSARCTDCESALRQLERLQEVVSAHVVAAVDDLDLSTFWSDIEHRLGPSHLSWTERVRVWWGEREWTWTAPGWPALAAVGVAIAIGFALIARVQTPTTQPDAPQIAARDNAAVLDSLDTDASSVAVLNDPETRTMVLWVSDDDSVGEAR